MLGVLVLAAALLGDVQPFVEKNTTVLVVERGDLNGDAREDAVLVLEPDDPDQPRPLLILVRDEKGTLRLAKRSAKAVLCRDCGGIMGDCAARLRREGRSSRWDRP